MSNITLLDFFAAQAMQALINARANMKEEHDTSFDTVTYCGVNTPIDLGKENGGNYTWNELLCEEAFEIAEQMIKTKYERVNK